MKTITGRRRGRRLDLPLVGLALLACGCSDEWDLEGPVTGAVLATCVEPGHGSAVSQPGATSLDFGDRTLWVFGETLLARPNATGEASLPSTAAWVDRSAAICRGDFDYLTGASGDLASLVPYTPAESAFNDTSRAGAVRLAPRGGCVVNGTGFVYYDKILSHGFLDATRLGTGIARVERDGTTTRLVPGVFAEEPTLLWRALGHGWGADAWLDGDGFVYVYRTAPSGTFTWEVYVARVLPGRIADVRAYEYFTGWEWESTSERSGSIFSGGSDVSVAFNAFDHRYVAVYAQPLSNDIVMRTAENPWGPWEVALPLFEGAAPEHLWVSQVRQHPAFARDRDRTILISYWSNPAVGPSGLHLSTFDLGGI